MRTWVVAAALAWGGAVAAQETDGAQGGTRDGAGIEAVILDQLGDFVARDVAGAWEHASPMIQGMFGTPGNFGTMVEQGYPMVWDNRDATFAELREEGGEIVQTVRVMDPEGRLWLLDYRMVEVEGVWRIDGVWVRPAPELAA